MPMTDDMIDAALAAVLFTTAICIATVTVEFTLKSIARYLRHRDRLTVKRSRTRTR